MLSLTAARSEQTLQLVIIDPKQTDFAKFNTLPHLRNGTVITDASAGVTLLRTIAVLDMAERSRLLPEVRTSHPICRAVSQQGRADIR